MPYPNNREAGLGYGHRIIHEIRKDREASIGRRGVGASLSAMLIINLNVITKITNGCDGRRKSGA